MALGENLRLAREAKGQTISQVAEATRMMVQIVEDLEREDFRRIAAPIYGRGFIKLYAESLGLDPDPLLREFMEIYTGSRPPQVVRRNTSGSLESGGADLPDGQAGESSAILTPSDSNEPDLFSMAAQRSEAIRSVADSSQAGDETTPPPRVRTAPGSRASLRATNSETTRLQEPARLRSATAADPTRFGTRFFGDLIPSQWIPAIIGAIAAIILLLLVGVFALSRKPVKADGSKAPSVKVQRVLGPAAPYFD